MACRRTPRRPFGDNGFLSEISIRTASQSDYPAIARIQQACPEAAQWPVGDYSNYGVLLALSSGKPAGFCAWRATAPAEIEILNLAVDPSLRHRGVASALLCHLAQSAPGELFLEVAADNLPALALYRKLGWKQVGIRPGYYGRGQTDAIVMKKSSC